MNTKNVLCDNCGKEFALSDIQLSRYLKNPSKHWYNIKTHRHITDNLLRHHGCSQLHSYKNYQLYPKGMSNEQLMLDNGYLPVFDCGQNTYIWQK